MDSHSYPGPLLAFHMCVLLLVSGSRWVSLLLPLPLQLLAMFPGSLLGIPKIWLILIAAS